jgi:hypothetical protein
MKKFHSEKHKQICTLIGEVAREHGVDHTIEQVSDFIAGYLDHGPGKLPMKTSDMSFTGHVPDLSKVDPMVWDRTQEIFNELQEYQTSGISDVLKIKTLFGIITKEETEYVIEELERKRRRNPDARFVGWLWENTFIFESRKQMELVVECLYINRSGLGKDVVFLRFSFDFDDVIQDKDIWYLLQFPSIDLLEFEKSVRIPENLTKSLGSAIQRVLPTNILIVDHDALAMDVVEKISLVTRSKTERHVSISLTDEPPISFFEAFLSIFEKSARPVLTLSVRKIKGSTLVRFLQLLYNTLDAFLSKWFKEHDIMKLFYQYITLRAKANSLRRERWMVSNKTQTTEETSLQEQMSGILDTIIVPDVYLTVRINTLTDTLSQFSMEEYIKLTMRFNKLLEPLRIKTLEDGDHYFKLWLPKSLARGPVSAGTHPEIKFI